MDELIKHIDNIYRDGPGNSWSDWRAVPVSAYALKEYHGQSDHGHLRLSGLFLFSVLDAIRVYLS